MKRIAYILLAIVAVAASSCQSSEDYSSLPDPIAKFVSQYWPNPDIESYSQPTSSTYVVTIRNSATLTFNSDYAWTEIDGNGMPLPEVLLYDQLPEPLYDYLEGDEAIGQVFRIIRDTKKYSVSLLSTTVNYDISTGKIN